VTTVFEVDTIFRIVNRASPTITAILRQVRELNAAVDKARLSIADLGKGAGIGSAGLSAAVAETKALAAAWGDVAKNAATARTAMGGASMAAARSAVPSAFAGGGGGRRRPGWLGGGGAHINGPGVGLPGGGHMRLGGGAMAAAGVVGYGAYQAAEIEDAVFQLTYHLGAEQNEATHSRLRKIIQDAMTSMGSACATSPTRQSKKSEFQGTAGGGIDVLPEMLKSAGIEARLRGSSLDESMTALVGLAHMTKQYDPEAIKKLAPAFAFLSTADPRSLSSIERAAGYSVPLLQSGLEIDPLQSLVAGTALARAGITSTKSGTWLREMATRAMPGSALQSDKAYEKHEGTLYKFGLVDEHGKPTWFTDNKPDIMKLLGIVGETAPRIPLTERTGYELQLFGRQGAGAISTLTDPAVLAQVQSLRQQMDSSEFKNRYAGFQSACNNSVTAQGARTAMRELDVTLMDIGRTVLPSVNVALGHFRDLLRGIRDIIPGGSVRGAEVGGQAMLGATGGAVVGGVVAGVPGAIIGGLGGGALGAANAVMPKPNMAKDAIQDTFGKFSGIIDHSATATDKAADQMRALTDVLRQRATPGPGGIFPGGTSRAPPTPPIHLNLNIDGRQLAAAVSEQQTRASTYDTAAPASDGSSFYGP
jgi:hypothetical protein